VVVYFSDNGPNTRRWTGGMKGIKGGTDEGGVRSICYLRWPAKLPAGHTVAPIAAAIDLLPTLTALAGVPRVGDRPLDGRDLSPLLLKQPGPWPDRPIFSTWAGQVSVRTQTHRFDQAGQLFDMIADPGQTTPINATEPELAAQLAAAARAWKREMLDSPALTAATRPSPGNPGNPPGGGAVDPRPIPVGYPEFPVTMLPARDGEPRGGVRRSGIHPNCSYFVEWRRLDDAMVWFLDVHTAGRYEVTVDYTCPVPDAGSRVELAFRDRRLVGRVAPGWDPPLLENQDTLPRPNGESRMKDFRPLRLGEIRLPAGEGVLTLRALEIPGGSVMDVRRVTLTLVEGEEGDR
jgi:hypothetical protein